MCVQICSHTPQRHIIIKLLKIRDKQQTLKAARKKIHYIEKKMTAHFSPKNHVGQKTRNDIFSVLKGGKNLSN